MDETIRKPDIGATIRVDAAPTTSKRSVETTVRPGSVADNSQAGDGDFILKGRIYRGIKCLSDNWVKPRFTWFRVKKARWY